MAKFSDKFGFSEASKKKASEVFQSECADLALRTDIWNIFLRLIYSNNNLENNTQVVRVILELIWAEVYQQSLDDLRGINYATNNSAKDQIKELYFNSEWYRVYDFIEKILSFLMRLKKKEYQYLDEILSALIKQNNIILEQNNSVWRISEESNSFIRLVDPLEIEAIDEALQRSDSAIKQHLSTALSLLSDRKSPDYRNSIKESISAIESQVRLKSGETRGDFSKCVESLGIHGAMKEAFKKLYGYTSDESGIRHALIEGGRTPDYNEAKFMLVSCSAFISFLNAKC